LIVLAFASAAGASPDIYEPDDMYQQARPLTVGGSQARSIDPLGDYDWAYFVVSAASTVTVATSGVNGDTMLYLYRSNATTLVTSDDDSGDGAFSRISNIPLAAGKYYVLTIEYGSNALIPLYYLQLWGDNIAGAGEFSCVSHAIRSDSDGDGQVSAGETVSMYVLARNSGTTDVTGITTSLAALSTGVTVLSSSSVYPDMVPGQVSSNVTPFAFSVPSGFRQGGIPFRLVASATSAAGRTFTNEFMVPVVIAPDMYEPDNTATQAVALELGMPVQQSRTFHLATDQDWYRISVSNDSVLRFGYTAVYPSTLYSTYTLYRDGGGVLTYVQEMSSSSSAWLSVEATRGTYYLLCRPYNAPGIYEFAATNWEVAVFEINRASMSFVERVSGDKVGKHSWKLKLAGKGLGLDSVVGTTFSVQIYDRTVYGTYSMTLPYGLTPEYNKKRSRLHSRTSYDVFRCHAGKTSFCIIEDMQDTSIGAKPVPRTVFALPQIQNMSYADLGVTLTIRQNGLTVGRGYCERRVTFALKGDKYTGKSSRARE